mgnify:CR=1 FL=1
MPKSQVRNAFASGTDVLIKTDVQGAATLRQKNRKGVFVFLIPPSLAALEERLRKRRTEPPEAIRKRLTQAKQELSSFKHYDYVVVNEVVEDSLQRIKAIILAEKSRMARNQELLKKLLM